MKLISGVCCYLFISHIAWAQVPSAVQEANLETLISQIPTLTELNSFYEEDLNNEAVQIAIVDTNPALISKLPKGVILQEKPIMKLAEKFYRFDFFLPVSLRSQKPVKEAFSKFARIYTRDFNKYLASATKFLHEGKGTYLMHPDYFYDSTFVFVYEVTCSNQSTPGYDPRMPPEYAMMMMNRGMPQQKENSERKLMFDYISTQGTFNKRQKDLFLAKHQSTPMPMTCYPADFLADEEFVLAMNAKFPNSNFVETAFNMTKNADLKDLYYEKVIKKITNDFRGSAFKEVKAEDWSALKMQVWLFENPSRIKELDPGIKFDQVLLENFVKIQFKPDRFFSETQKLDKDIAAILEKYPNRSEEFQKAGKEQALIELGKVRCCGTLYSEGISKYMKNLPDEFLTDPAFIVSGIQKVKAEEDLYLNELQKRNAFSEAIKNYLVENIQSFRSICNRVSGNHLPTFLKEDKKLLERIKLACDNKKEV